MTITLEVFAILLSIVAFIVTIVGFFASLRFYREGMQLQQAANDALVRLTEKTASIQTQVGSMFDKTLDAALGKHNEFTSRFADIENQLGEAKSTLLGEAYGQIGEGETQLTEDFKTAVEHQLKQLEKKVESARESIEEAERMRLMSIMSGFSRPASKQEIWDIAQHKYPEVTLYIIEKLLLVLCEEGFVERYGGGEYLLNDKGRQLAREYFRPQ
mgnify:CR=1 FL=1